MTEAGEKSEARRIEFLAGRLLAGEMVRRKRVESTDRWQFKRKFPIPPERLLRL
jgi:4'-phosphopantetheinyl transferase EntD